MSPLAEQIKCIQFLCAFFLVFVPLVLLAVLALQGNLTFSIFKTKSRVQPTLDEYDSLPKTSVGSDEQMLHVGGVLENKYISSVANPDLDGQEGIKRQIELQAMQLVREYEERDGRDVEDVSMYYAGYDFKSYGSKGFRAIEVKGKASSGNVHITANEWRTAKEFGDNYFLYIVEDTLSAKPKLKIIQNPYQRLQVKVNKVQYVLPRKIYCNAPEVIKLEMAQ